jgi:hypothetical protein
LIGVFNLPTVYFWQLKHTSLPVGPDLFFFPPGTTAMFQISHPNSYFPLPEASTTSSSPLMEVLPFISLIELSAALWSSKLIKA